MHMATKFKEQFRHRLHGIQKMERRNAAAGALRQAVLGVVAEHESWTMKTLYEARRHDAQNAAVPIRSGEHQREIGLADRRQLALFQHRPHDCFLRLLTLAVQRMKLLSNLARTHSVTG